MDVGLDMGIQVGMDVGKDVGGAVSVIVLTGDVTGFLVSGSGSLMRIGLLPSPGLGGASMISIIES